MARKPESPSLGMQEAGYKTRPELLVCGGAPRRNRTGDPILTIDAPVVHTASQDLLSPHNHAGEKRCRGLRCWAGRGCVWRSFWQISGTASWNLDMVVSNRIHAGAIVPSALDHKRLDLRCTAVLGGFGSSVGRTGKRHPLWQVRRGTCSWLPGDDRYGRWSPGRSYIRG